MLHFSFIIKYNSQVVIIIKVIKLNLVDLMLIRELALIIHHPKYQFNLLKFLYYFSLKFLQYFGLKFQFVIIEVVVSPIRELILVLVFDLINQFIVMQVIIHQFEVEDFQIYLFIIEVINLKLLIIMAIQEDLYLMLFIEVNQKDYQEWQCFQKEKVITHYHQPVVTKNMYFTLPHCFETSLI